ncbi:MAG: glycosyltransferase family protein [Limisphaerales bacterium]
MPVDLPGQYLLAYVLNQGYAKDIIRWHTANPQVMLHCFCEKPKVEPVWHYDDTLTFHKLDGNKFLRMMSECRGVACTAGFESLNEAAWLGKPLLVVPVENHVEQYLNALDAERAGLAKAADGFDLTALLARTPTPSAKSAAYRSWVRRAEAVLLSVIETTGRATVPTFVPVRTEAAMPGRAG